MEKHPMTPEGYAKLKEELSRLKNKERPYIIGEIATAREHGDLSENAEYHAAKDRQGMIEARISILESTVGLAEVIDISNISSDRIQFGASVTVIDEETEEESTYQIVGAEEADVNEGRLSVSAPLARALIGKSEGDAIEIHAPGGTRNYEILAIKYN
ncbi:MAG: transcription elongation factor GreA [Rhodospirillaceae bacterium]|jgi:transcription elongation factor GreA|nr:transcription elongation factor GreA [Rhodospirillaceae bacterium]MBT3926242.1 transcription elongation factor GreA [Rhodospirillaceae bacterium]MBT4428457.1 transcription elongation factor GreA [Rhodospirillaceae bacterium]MBT5038621.1 transcription elongation factor GreA [Rhodospirillaceae bacterium]MBT5674580.1 transcription elongation factor GreA [Rhodospirillaceae bacterium]